MSVQSNIFIFVVCGGREHIETLHYSLQYLKFHSKNKIWVLTDSARNEIPIIHDSIIDVLTPSEFDHHQASIYLKTGIHKFLPKGNLYCYLDTDILALSKDVDEIFNNYNAPISFAPDHCTMDRFSPYAVNCNCQNLYEGYHNKIEATLKPIDPLRNSTDSEILYQRKKLVQFYQKKLGLIGKLTLGLKFLFAINRFKLNDEVYFDQSKKAWITKDNLVFMHYFSWSRISRLNGLKWSYFKGEPILPDGRSLWKMECDHLAKFISDKFSVDIKNKKFQHWNGGVFLFDDQSHEFLEVWFNSTMEIFKDKNWKTRDQGTLIKTVWQFGLENHPTLSKKWNLIADYHSPSLSWKGKQVRLSENELIAPNLLHVYHHFGDENWEFWNQIPTIN